MIHFNVKCLFFAALVVLQQSNYATVLVNLTIKIKKNLLQKNILK